MKKISETSFYGVCGFVALYTMLVAVLVGWLMGKAPGSLVFPFLGMAVTQIFSLLSKLKAADASKVNEVENSVVEVEETAKVARAKANQLAAKVELVEDKVDKVVEVVER